MALAKSPSSPGAEFPVPEMEVSGPPHGLCGELVSMLIHAGEVSYTMPEKTDAITW